MKKRLTAALLSGAAASTLLLTGTASAAPSDVCTGLAEVDGCSYCSYEAGIQAQPPSYCDFWGPEYGYTWQQCAVFAADVCVLGKVN